MRIKGINEAYTLEVKRCEKGIIINIMDIAFNGSGIIISEENWEKIIEDMKKVK